MPSLVSPGVSVSVIDESFYIPASAPTVPLFFVATRSGKMQPDGVTSAAGTNEHSMIRTVTSIGQSVQLYGIPYFHQDESGNEFHGDARNEVGLMALNQTLGVINRAYVVRANVNLNDDTVKFVGIGTAVAGEATLVGAGNGTIGSVTVTSSSVQTQTVTVTFLTPTTFSVVGSKVGFIGNGTVGAAFTSSTLGFTVTAGSTPFAVEDYFTIPLVWEATAGGSNVGNGVVVDLMPDSTVAPDTAAAGETWTVTFTSSTAFSVSGSVTGASTAGTVGTAYDNGKVNFTIVAGSTPFQTGDVFTVAFATRTISNPLGSSDAQRRQAIVTALQSCINMNTEVRAVDNYEYNLISCPGYHEVVDELLALSQDINQEALVIADTPVNKTPETTAQWALTTARKTGSNVAYYYPWGLASNLDGRDVACSPAGLALRTIGYSDSQGYVWDAPAGARRGLVTGVSQVGFVTGTLGTATTWVETNLNNGQRDNLYEAQKNINPIAFFPGRGILVFGQKTSATASSAMDRVNVVRLVMYLKRALRKGSFPFIFEINDQLTRDDFKAAADGILGDVMAKRGLYDYATLCDESNNTPSRIDNNEMYLDVAIKPTKTAEFLYVNIRVLSTGAEMPG